MGFLVGQPATLRRVESVFWELVCAGVPRVEAARRAGVSTTTGESWFGAAGGVRPRLVGGVEAGGRRRWLSECEREHIALRLAEGAGVRQIARELARAPSTISREITRNGFTRNGYYPDGRPKGRWRYRGLLAQSRADARRRRPKHRKFVQHPRLAERVQTGLDKAWSPRQVAVSLRREFPDESEMWVSHETIYQSLYVQGRGGLRRDLHTKLRTGRALGRVRWSV